MELRREYKKRIFKARRNYEEYKCSELESMMGNPKKWWALAKKLKVAGSDYWFEIGVHFVTFVVLTVHKLLCGLFEGSRSGGGM